MLDIICASLSLGRNNAPLGTVGGIVDPVRDKELLPPPGVPTVTFCALNASLCFSKFLLSDEKENQLNSFL